MKALYGVLLATGVAISLPAHATGVAPGTRITNTATVQATIGGTALSLTSNTTSLTVDQLVDVTVTWQNSGPVQVISGSSQQALLFRVTNTGNGTDSFTLTANTSVPGGNFNPNNAQIYFDSAHTGVFSASDTLYVPGSNDPSLASGTSVDMFIVADIPGGLPSGDVGYAALTAASKTFTGTPGSVKTGGGVLGTDAVTGHSGGQASATGTYQVGNGPFTFIKSAVITDPSGGSQPVSGAVITYTLKVTPTGLSSANSATVTDSIPANTTYVPGSMSLNGTPLADGGGGSDPGDYNVTTPGAITVKLGALASNAPAQTIVFKVKIN